MTKTNTSQRDAAHAQARTPQQIDKWLSSLPMLNNEKMIRTLCDSLLELNCAELADSTRFEILEVYQSHVESVAYEIQKRKVGLSLPLSVETSKLADSITSLFNQVALGYKIIVLNAMRQGSKYQELSSNKVVWACYWALIYLTEVLRSAYESYRPYPKGVWKEAHELFTYAFTEGFVHYKLAIEGTDALSRDSIRGAYKRLLLMGLSNPYQLPFRAVRSVYELLERLVHKVALTPSSHTKKSPCMFVVDFELDQPGVPYLSRSSVVDNEECFLLDTTELVITLRHELERIINNEPIELGNESSIYDSERVDMLRSLIVQWGIRPIRTSARIQNNRQADMSVGLNSVYSALSGWKEIDQEHVTPQRGDTREMLKGTFGYQQFRQTHKISLIPDWEIVDESLAGLQLAHQDPSRAQIRVGECVAIADEQQGWIVGIIRWARSGQANDVNLGIFKLGANGNAAAVQQVEGSSGPDVSTFVLAVVLLETEALGRRQMLVAPKGHYSPGSPLWLRTAGKDQVMVDPATLIVSTRLVDCFEFRIIS
ncbi:MAG: hypothetical protein OEU36_08170 [Gammaproteobacteria bacterium]|nr:hypothetical protein [Gammaproteobacteria bacterium]